MSAIELPEVKMNLHTPKNPATGRVVKSEICSSRKGAGIVRHIEIDVSGTDLAGNIRPGQAFGVLAPGEDAKGKPHKVRLYSVASPSRGEDGNGNVIATTVKRVVEEHWETHKLFQGVCSNYLCDLQVGDEVKVSGPNGKSFLIPKAVEDHDYMFFATGTGIAPFRAMLIDLLESGTKSQVYLFMGTPYETDLLYDDVMRKYAEEYDNFHYITAISRHNQRDDDLGPMYIDERLDTHKDELLPILKSGRAMIYVCGIAGMELGITKRLAKMLDPSDLAQFMEVDAETLADVDNWTRKTLKKPIRLTHQLCFEVY